MASSLGRSLQIETKGYPSDTNTTAFHTQDVVPYFDISNRRGTITAFCPTTIFSQSEASVGTVSITMVLFKSFNSPSSWTLNSSRSLYYRGNSKITPANYTNYFSDILGVYKNNYQLRGYGTNGWQVWNAIYSKNLDDTYWSDVITDASQWNGRIKMCWIPEEGKDTYYYPLGDGDSRWESWTSVNQETSQKMRQKFFIYDTYPMKVYNGSSWVSFEGNAVNGYTSSSSYSTGALRYYDGSKWV